ncbi:MAG TPA: preprotein translocase subunit SecG [Gammaproteobacteria bacterium]
MLHTILLSLHLLACLFIVALVLLQRGKGAEAGTGFGAGASGTVFGARGSASFLSRATAALATTFFATSLALAFLGQDQTAPESLLERAAPTEQQPQAAPPPAEEDIDRPPPLPSDDSQPSDLPEIDSGEGEPAPATEAPND